MQDDTTVPHDLLTPVGMITINTGDKEGAYKALKAAGLSDDEIEEALAFVEFSVSDIFDGFLTSDDATVLGTNHIGYYY